MTVVDVVKKTYVDAQDKKLGFPIVIDNADRTAQFPVPLASQRVFNLSTGNIERWVGAAWQTEFEGTGGGRTRYNTKAVGLTADSVFDDFAKLNTLVNGTMQPAGGQLDVVGVVAIGSNITIPTNVTVKFLEGAYFAPMGGVNINFNGRLFGPTRKRFGGAGTITFGRGTVFKLRPEWWGADPSGATDSLIPFQNCARDACATAFANGSLGVTVKLSESASYLLTGTVTTNRDRVHWEGSNRYSPQIICNPATAKVIFMFQAVNPAQVLYQCSITGVSFTGQGTQQKVAVHLADCSDFMYKNITTNNWTGNSGSTATPSIAIRSAGRELLTVKNVTLFADRPIHITSNPNAPNAAEDCDHFRFTNIYVMAQVATESNILLDPNVSPSNMTFDGKQAWIAGKYGFRWQSGGTSGTAGFCLSFSNVRYEQSADATGWAFRFEQVEGMNQVAFYNCHFGGTNGHGGVYITGSENVTFNTCIYAGATGIAFDISGSGQVWFINTFAQAGSTVNLGSLVEILSLGQRVGGSPIPPTCYFQSPTTTVKAIKIGGVYVMKYQGVVPAGGTLALSLLSSGNGMQCANVQFSGYAATGPIQASGAGAVDRTGATQGWVGGAGAFGNVGAKLCLFYAPNPTSILNNCAQPMHTVVDTTATYV